MAVASSEYPVQLEIDPATSQNRLTALLRPILTDSPLDRPHRLGNPSGSGLDTGIVLDPAHRTLPRGPVAVLDWRDTLVHAGVWIWRHDKRRCLVRRWLSHWTGTHRSHWENILTTPFV